MEVICQDRVEVRGGTGQQDIKDWLTAKGIIKQQPEKNAFLLIVPVIASNPTAGIIFGGGLTYAFKTKPTDERLSTLSSNASYSTKGLLNLNVKSNAFVLGERMVLNSDWRFLLNAETTYGLGTDKAAPGSIDLNGYPTTDSAGQELKYYQVRLHQTGSWKLMPDLFAGIGFQYDYFYDIEDAVVTAGDTTRSYQYQYSVKHGFDPKHYSASGISLNVLYDSRDNQISAYKGTYANVNFRANLEGLGSTRNSSMLLTEYRTYISLGQQRYRHILGIWLYGNFVTGGNVPYLLLPAVGYDQRQKTGRGYTFGQFRGEDMIYGEGEYRFPISANTGILGGVCFLNCTTTSDRQEHTLLFDYLKPAYGGGLRIMLDKKTRTRLEIDAGVADKTLGFYFGAQETF